MKHKEIIVGIFAAAALALLYFGFNYLKGTDFFADNANYFVKYDNVSELAVSNPVLVNGYAVGRVSRISLMPKQKNKVLVELEIEGDVRVGKNAKATLSSALLGSKSILLDLGDISSPVKRGDTITGELAKGMLDLISETASPVAYDMQSTLKKFNGIIDDLTVTLNEINPVIHRFRETPGKLNTMLDQGNQSMVELTSTIRDASEKLKGTMSELDPTLKNLKVISDSLRQIEINRTLVKTQKTLEELSDLMARLKKGDNTASKLLTDDELYNNLNSVLTSIDSLTTHMNNNPDHFFAPLGKSSKKIKKELRKEEERSRKSQ